MCNIIKFDKNIEIQKQVKYLLIRDSFLKYIYDLESAVGQIIGYLDANQSLNRDSAFIRLYEIATCKDNKNERVTCLYSSDNPIDLMTLL